MMKPLKVIFGLLLAWPVLFAVMLIGTLVFVSIQAALRPKGPSAIEALRSGELAPQNVTNVAVICHHPAGYMPFTQKEYAQYRETSLPDRGTITNVLTLLRSASNGMLHKNHPTKAYGGFLRIDCADGTFYYVYYDMYYRGEYYVSISANRRNELNPNCARAYHSRDLVWFLREHDPWFEDFMKEGIPANKELNPTNEPAAGGSI